MLGRDWTRFWEDVMTPTGGDSYEWGLLFAGHFALGTVLGAIFTTLYLPFFMLTGISISPLWLFSMPLGYWLIKEVLLDGVLGDGFVDGIAVFFGTLLIYTVVIEASFISLISILIATGICIYGTLNRLPYKREEDG